MYTKCNIGDIRGQLYRTCNIGDVIIWRISCLGFIAPMFLLLLQIFLYVMYIRGYYNLMNFPFGSLLLPCFCFFFKSICMHVCFMLLKQHILLAGMKPYELKILHNLTTSWELYTQSQYIFGVFSLDYYWILFKGVSIPLQNLSVPSLVYNVREP